MNEFFSVWKAVTVEILQQAEWVSDFYTSHKRCNTRKWSRSNETLWHTLPKTHVSVHFYWPEDWSNTVKGRSHGRGAQNWEERKSGMGSGRLWPTCPLPSPFPHLWSIIKQTPDNILMDELTTWINIEFFQFLFWTQTSKNASCGKAKSPLKHNPLQDIFTVNRITSWEHQAHLATPMHSWQVVLLLQLSAPTLKYRQNTPKLCFSCMIFTEL